MWARVCFLSSPCLTTLHLAPSLLALTPVFLQHQSSAACTSLMGKDEQDGKAGRGDALGRGQACPGQRRGQGTAFQLRLRIPGEQLVGWCQFIPEQLWGPAEGQWVQSALLRAPLLAPGVDADPWGSGSSTGVPPWPQSSTGA